MRCDAILHVFAVLTLLPPLSLFSQKGEHIFWTAVASVAVAVYVVGIPLLLLILLCVNQRRGTLEFPAIEYTYNGNGVIEPEQVNTAVRRLDEYFRNRVAFGSLYDQYEASFYWFEFGCTMRKMILTGALVLFGAGTSPPVVTALAVCILWLTLIANLNPFGDDVDDRLAQVEAIQILFTLLIGLVLQLQATSEEGTKEEENALGVVLILLNLAVIALALVQQPVFLKIASRVFAVAVRIKERAASCGKAKDLDAAAAADAAVTGIEMQNNPSYVAANRTDGAEEAATKIEIRGNPLVPATGAGALGVEVDQVEDEQLGGAENSQLRAKNTQQRAEITQLRAEIEQLNQAQPGAVVELGVAAEAAPGRAARVGRSEAQNATSTAVDIDPPRRFDGNGYFTQEEFIAHYGGVDEWNAALPL